jgi:hypothetical protein
MRLTEADAGTRTPDPHFTRVVLYQLSYVGAGKVEPAAPRIVARERGGGGPRTYARALAAPSATGERPPSRRGAARPRIGLGPKRRLASEDGLPPSPPRAAGRPIARRRSPQFRGKRGLVGAEG